MSAPTATRIRQPRPIEGDPSDGRERGRIERGATDEQAVDPIPREDGRRTAWIHAATVDDADVRRVPGSLQGTADVRMHGLDVLRVRAARARPDGPDGLVRDHERGLRPGQELLEAALDLGLHHPPRGRRIRPFPFADAHDRCHAMPDGLRDLGRDHRVGLVVVATAFRMADLDVGAAQVREHPGGDIARVRAVLLSVHVLCPPRDGAPLEALPSHP